MGRVGADADQLALQLHLPAPPQPLRRQLQLDLRHPRLVPRRRHLLLLALLLQVRRLDLLARLRRLLLRLRGLLLRGLLLRGFLLGLVDALDLLPALLAGLVDLLQLLLQPPRPLQPLLLPAPLDLLDFLLQLAGGLLLEFAGSFLALQLVALADAAVVVVEVDDVLPEGVPLGLELVVVLAVLVVPQLLERDFPEARLPAPDLLLEVVQRLPQTLLALLLLLLLAVVRLLLRLEARLRDVLLLDSAQGSAELAVV